MTNIFIRCSSPGLFAEGVKEIRWVYCTRSGSIFFYHFSFCESLEKSVRDRNENPSNKKIVVNSPTSRERHKYLYFTYKLLSNNKAY
ncbi:MAG: hypothetical protein ABIU77_10055 [Ferruginibacter sp.]